MIEARDGMLWTCVDVGKALRCSPQHVRRLVVQGVIPAKCVRRLGRLLRFHPGLIRDWIDEGDKVRRRSG